MRHRYAATLVALAALLLAAPAGAASIQNVNVVLSNSATPSPLTPPPPVDPADPDDVYVVNSATSSACNPLCTSLDVRQLGSVGLESDGAEQGIYDFSMSYTTSFDVVPVTPGENWQLSITTRMVGALTVNSDLFLGTAGATINGAVGTPAFSGPGTASLSSGSLDLGGVTLPSTGADADQPFPSPLSSLARISGSDAVTVSLTFTVSGAVESFGACFGGFFCNAPEAAVRMGELDPDTLPFFTAADYPGPGNRDPAQDGHFLSVALASVPEPSSAALLASAAILLAVGRRARRRA